MRVASGDVLGAPTTATFIRSRAVKSFLPSLARGSGASFFAGCLSSGAGWAQAVAGAMKQSSNPSMIEKRLGFIERSSRKRSFGLSSELRGEIMSDKLQFVD